MDSDRTPEESRALLKDYAPSLFMFDPEVPTYEQTYGRIVMNTCSICEYWTPVAALRPGLRMDACLPGWGACNNVADISDAEDYGDAHGVGFATTDYEGYASSLFTSPAFGCNQWEAKS